MRHLRVLLFFPNEITMCWDVFLQLMEMISIHKGNPRCHFPSCPCQQHLFNWAVSLHVWHLLRRLCNLARIVLHMCFTMRMDSLPLLFEALTESPLLTSDCPNHRTYCLQLLDA